MWEILVIITMAFYIIGTYVVGIGIMAAVFVFHVVVVPLIFKYSKTFRRTLTFANFVQWPMNIDFENPAKSGIEGARNLTVEFESRVDNCHIKLGVWHILPLSAYLRLKKYFEDTVDKKELNYQLDEELIMSEKPIIFYCHGNSNCRATYHRLMMYKFFQKMEFHTIAFDYRGFGDSTAVPPSEAGVVEDALRVYAWLRRAAQSNGRLPVPKPIFVWGHSLGTGIAASMLGDMKKLSHSILDREPLQLPNGLVLEAPFKNLADEVRHHPLAKLVAWLPYHEATFVRPFESHPEQQFRTDRHLSRMRHLPVLMLHAQDDAVVPYHVGYQLYQELRRTRMESGAALSLHAFRKTHRLGHKYICLAKDLPTIVGNFVERHL